MEYKYKALTMIRHLRKIKEWSQQELAEKSGVSVLTIQKLEHGWLDPYECKYSTLLKIAKTLGCPRVDTLFQE